MRHKRIPTDLQILDAIYRQHYADYADFSLENRTRTTKIYVPIDLDTIADGLNQEVDIVFGRLYYHLEHKYAYRQEDGTKVPFFALNVGDDIHVINFPLMASALANLQDQAAKYNTATRIAVGSFLVLRYR